MFDNLDPPERVLCAVLRPRPRRRSPPPPEEAAAAGVQATRPQRVGENSRSLGPHGGRHHEGRPKVSGPRAKLQFRHNLQGRGGHWSRQSHDTGECCFVVSPRPRRPPHNTPSSPPNLAPHTPLPPYLLTPPVKHLTPQLDSIIWVKLKDKLAGGSREEVILSSVWEAAASEGQRRGAFMPGSTCPVVTAAATSCSRRHAASRPPHTLMYWRATSLQLTQSLCSACVNINFPP